MRFLQGASLAGLIATVAALAVSFLSPAAVLRSYVFFTFLVPATVIACLGIMGHRDTEGGELELRGVFRTADRWATWTAAASFLVFAALLIVALLTGFPPDGIEPSQMEEHPHVTRFGFGIVALEFGLSVATVNSARKIRNAWMDVSP